MDCVPMTDVGLQRKNNQDSYSVMLAPNAEAWEKRGHVFLVADGMGGHAAGELASKIAADNVPHTYTKLGTVAAPSALVKSIKDANGQIHSRGKSSVDFHGMGTTCSTLVLMPHGAIVAHVGDSRVYRLRPDRTLEQLTFDHSLAWEMIARGQVRESQVALLVRKNIITRSLGSAPEVEVDLEGPFPTQPGDVFLVCSDGLSGQVEDQEIGSTLASLDPEEAARALVHLAILRGGPDNITAIVVRVKAPMLSSKPLEPLPLPGPEVTGRGKPPQGGLIGWWKNTFGSGASGGGQKPFGKGPYRVYPCNADAKFTLTLASLIQELREAADAEKWSVDWDRFNSHCDLAARSAAEQNHPNAIREYCMAMSYMMSELRNRRRKKL